MKEQGVGNEMGWIFWNLQVCGTGGHLRRRENREDQKKQNALLRNGHLCSPQDLVLLSKHGVVGDRGMHQPVARETEAEDS